MILFYLFVLVFILIICLLVTLFFVMEIVAAFTTDAPFVPIPDEAEKYIIRKLKLSDTSILYDLGCGDGRVLETAVASNPYVHGVGIEKAWLPYLLARFRTRHNTHISMRREDIFKADVNNATHVFLYLYPAVLNRLWNKLKSECMPGTRIVSCDFECTERTADEIVIIGDGTAKRGKKLFIYTV